MPRCPLESRLPVVALFLLLASCGDDRMAGTSTSVGTGIGGKASLADGNPAAGARVLVRSEDLRYVGDAPAHEALDSTVTDREGNFSLPGTRSGPFYLEIIGPDPQSMAGTAGPGAASGAEVYLRHFARPPRGGNLGTLSLAVPGTVTGKVRAPAPEGGGIWVGMKGGGRFLPIQGRSGVKIGEPVDFRLEGVAPGVGDLVVAYLPDSVAAKIDPVEVRATITSGAETDLGLVGD